VLLLFLAASRPQLCAVLVLLPLPQLLRLLPLLLMLLRLRQVPPMP